MIKTQSLKIIKLLFGLFLYSLGIVCSLQANIGLAPWDAFSIGVTNVTGLTYGDVIILSGIVILCGVLFLKEKIGVGTILNTLLIGVMADILIKWHVIPLMHHFFTGILMLLLGQIIISVASYFYIGQGLGSGPRDSLMIALSKRLPKIPVGGIRGAIEGTVLLIGWFLGAKVGIGTVIAVFGIGFILQTTFRILRFDVKKVEHDSIFATFKHVKQAFVE